MPTGSPTPWSYICIRCVVICLSLLLPLSFPRLLFKFVLKIFYGTIVVENAHLIPETGKPWYDVGHQIFFQNVISMQYCVCESQQLVDRRIVRSCSLISYTVN